MTRNDISDSDREILAELERMARPSAEDVEELLAEADDIETVFGELLDSINYMPEPFDTAGTTVELDPSEYPY